METTATLSPVLKDYAIEQALTHVRKSRIKKNSERANPEQSGGAKSQGR